MKLLAFVDLHGSKSMLKKIAALVKTDKIEYVVSAGDITIFGDSMLQIINSLDAIGVPVLMVHGNHEDAASMKRICEKTKNVKFIHKQAYEAGEYVFLGYGGGGFSSIDKDFEEWTNSAMHKIPEGKKIILVTHAPPHGTKLDMILDQPAGSKSIRHFIKHAQPKLAISGHLHENAGMKDRIDKSKLVNPGPWGMILNV